VILGVGGGLLVYHAGLHPECLRPGGHGVSRRRHHLLAAAEHVHDVHPLADLLHQRVGFFAEDRLVEVRVDGEDPEAEVLEGPRYRVARPVRAVGEPDDRHGARPFEKGPYLLYARVLVQIDSSPDAVLD
jgi:hypothetical protein